MQTSDLCPSPLRIGLIKHTDFPKKRLIGLQPQICGPGVNFKINQTALLHVGIALHSQSKKYVNKWD